MSRVYNVGQVFNLPSSTRKLETCATLIEPALRILGIVQRQRLLGQLQRVLCIEHYRELFRARRVLAGHDRARMRAVRNAARMQRDRAALDSAARAKIPAHIKQYLVGFDVVVHPWSL